MENTSAVNVGLFRGFPKYLVRWLIFGAIAGALQPVIQNVDQFWTVKMYQALSGLPFGAICAVLFTPLQNRFNPARKTSVTWGLAIAIWLVAKAIMAAVLVAL